MYEGIFRSEKPLLLTAPEGKCYALLSKKSGKFARDFASVGRSG
jgi:hypothetical protein